MSAHSVVRRIPALTCQLVRKNVDVNLFSNWLYIKNTYLLCNNLCDWLYIYYTYLLCNNPCDWLYICYTYLLCNNLCDWLYIYYTYLLCNNPCDWLHIYYTYLLCNNLCDWPSVIRSVFVNSCKRNCTQSQLETKYNTNKNHPFSSFFSN